jgi:hypothetical protein
VCGSRRPAPRPLFRALTDPDAYSPQDDEWIQQATSRVEEATDSLISEFARFLTYIALSIRCTSAFGRC